MVEAEAKQLVGLVGAQLESMIVEGVKPDMSNRLMALAGAVDDEPRVQAWVEGSARSLEANAKQHECSYNEVATRALNVGIATGLAVALDVITPVVVDIGDPSVLSREDIAQKLQEAFALATQRR